MNISRACKLSELNWGALPDFPARLDRLGITVDKVSVEISRYPDSITYYSLEKAVQDVHIKGAPKEYRIYINGKLSDKSFSLDVIRGTNIYGEKYLNIAANGIEESETLDSMMTFLGLEADEPTTLPPSPKRTAFIAHRFDTNGTDCADKLARFLELIGFKVVTGRAYAPKSVASKVKIRIEEQAVIFVILTPGSDDTWLTQESIIGEVKGKPLIILKEKRVEFKPGILADHEYIPFVLSNMEVGFISVLEGLRELGYLKFY